MDLIYLDNNATTPLLPAVRAAMDPYFSECYGNPASAHRAGRRARQALEDAREAVAAHLQAFPDEVLFTSGATEANNLALFSLAGAPPGRILTSPLEHPSIVEPLRQLGERGFTIVPLALNAAGLIAPETLREALRTPTRLVTIQLANHETGHVQPIEALLSSLDSTLSIYSHSDATQAVGKLPVRFHNLGLTTLSFSGHKFHGPKGIGCLIVRRGTRLQPLAWGGHQQQGRRPGTEPVALAVGLAKALKLSQTEAEARYETLTQLRRRFLERLTQAVPPVLANGPAEGAPGYGLPHTLNLSFPGCRADTLLMNLDLAGIACSTGSACSSGSLLPSPVLQALGVPAEQLTSAMRFSLSPLLSEAQIDEAASRISKVVQRLRCTPTEAL